MLGCCTIRAAITVKDPIMPAERKTPDQLQIDWSTVSLPGLGPETVVLITGGTGAVGTRLAEALLTVGTRVAILSRSRERVDEVVQDLGGSDRLLGIAADITQEADAQSAVNQVLARFGRLDVLVQSAAVGGGGPLETITAAEIDAMFGANVKGMVLMAKAAAVPMRAQGSGRIINISSIVAHRVFTGRSIYGASKAAVNHLTRYLAGELSPDGITVNSVSPGQTPTALRHFSEAPGARPEPSGRDMYDAKGTPLGRRGVLDDYVGPILFLASDLAQYVSGADIVTDGGLTVTK
jgi:NAD(P)-dependent dehydrogenase (short-subunit alcohol dehydrogenase family)